MRRAKREVANGSPEIGGAPPMVPGQEILALFNPPPAHPKTTRMQSEKPLDPQKVKADIQKALADPALSKEIVNLADDVLERKRLKLAQLTSNGKNLVRLNAKAVGVWREFEREKCAHMRGVRQQMMREAGERREQMEEYEREFKEVQMRRWDIFKEKRERFIEYFVEVKNRQARNKQFVTFIIL